MSTFKLEIVATDKVFFRGDAEFVVIPALDGEMGVLAGHDTMVAAVKAGELRYTVNGQTELCAVGDGFAEILGDRVTIICDFAERAVDIDVMRAERAKERAEERIQAKKSQIEFVHSQAALARAMARLKVTSKINKR
ncbi:MAG: F0F1 ATP synthase subunit epsilon [Anaerovoracaceae bacterium]|jgi:F-type H+-transporting ATPase subunit epsilon|nr:F0F1 ATP synthase subunit epsilon [Bacillota bacterium]MDY2670858.1 F0F1 ATP synthase subunit epsilon [Anaerovoracaceae bacterium]